MFDALASAHKGQHRDYPRDHEERNAPCSFAVGSSTIVANVKAGGNGEGIT